MFTIFTKLSDNTSISINEDDIWSYGVKSVDGKQKNFIKVKGQEILIVENYAEMVIERETAPPVNINGHTRT